MDLSEEGREDRDSHHVLLLRSDAYVDGGAVEIIGLHVAGLTHVWLRMDPRTDRLRNHSMSGLHVDPATGAIAASRHARARAHARTHKAASLFTHTAMSLGVVPSSANPWDPQRATPCRFADFFRSSDRVTSAPNRYGREAGKTPRTHLGAGRKTAALVLHLCGIVPADLREEGGSGNPTCTPGKQLRLINSLRLASNFTSSYIKRQHPPKKLTNNISRSQRCSGRQRSSKSARRG